MESQQIRDLMKVALGEARADTAIINGDIVNVYTGEVLKGDTVLIKGGRIAYVGMNAAGSIGPSTEIIDAAGKVLIPGLIDGHTHVDSHCVISETLRYAVKGGVTTIITEIEEFTAPLGYKVVAEFLKSAKDQPVKVFIVVPPMVSTSRSSEEHAITVEQARRLLKKREVVGMGESYWMPVLAGNERSLGMIRAAVDAGKTADGHSAGARDNKLQAYFATGITSCHEPITAADALERLRLGLYVPVREGEMRHDLEAVSKIKDENIDLSRLVLSTDGIGPLDLVADGYMETVVQKAINLGFDPVTAVKMATVNPARQFRLDCEIGGIAPGRMGDIVIIPDLHNIHPETVISSGQIIFRQGKILAEPKKYTFPAWMEKSVKLTRDVTEEDFKIPAAGKNQSGKIRVLDLVSPLVTREAVIDVPVTNGELKIDTGKDLLKIAAIERMYHPGKTFTGLIRGLKMRAGAVADSAVWDSNVIIVAGADETDMALAGNRLRQLKGGLVICSGGRILAELALPVSGMVSYEPLETVASRLKDIQQAAAGLGFPFPDIRTTLDVMASPAIPFLRICEEGLYSVTRNEIVSLFVEE
jgi:adenine deaminase